MSSIQCCPECHTVWIEHTCQDYFHQMLLWDFEYTGSNPGVHHLAVLCYYLQHPGLYSPDGLNGAMQLLTDFLVRGLSPQAVRQRDKTKLDSGNRKNNIKASPASRGAYSHPVNWTITAKDVVEGGLDAYSDNVRAWAQAVLQDLKASGNLT
jgi:hypothetical protein